MSDIIHQVRATNYTTHLITPPEPVLAAYNQQLQPFLNASAFIGSIHGKNFSKTNITRAYRLFRRWKPTFVHFHCPYYLWGLDVVLAAHLARVPYVIRTEHNPMMNRPNLPTRMLLRLADQGVSAFTYVSNGNQQRYESYLPYRKGRGRVIPNGVDTSRFHPRNGQEEYTALRKQFGFAPETRLAVFVGAYGGRRPLSPILAAFRQLLNEQQTSQHARNWHLLIIGEGVEPGAELVEQHGLSDHATLLGRRSDIAQIVRNCDLFVSASHFEGMSVAMLEAWSSGVPVLTTDVDGISDIVGETHAAQIMAPHGDQAAYARLWKRFMEDDAELLALHRQASSIVRESFTTSHMLVSYENLYQQPVFSNPVLARHVAQLL